MGGGEQMMGQHRASDFYNADLEDEAAAPWIEIESTTKGSGKVLQTCKSNSFSLFPAP